ncbi:MAG: hypothetical protein B7Z26_00080 [Asticcacaulis sp. 32-58-5]|nr:MAG: hypothetical protein B7Z26_00080 [Asticcacaulis sp. 32-58-5]
MIDILFFGRVAIIMRKRSLKLALKDELKTLFAVRHTLLEEYCAASQVDIKAIQMSVNQVVVRNDVILSDGDEVAFFSVFSGG